MLGFMPPTASLPHHLTHHHQQQYGNEASPGSAFMPRPLLGGACLNQSPSGGQITHLHPPSDLQVTLEANCNCCKPACPVLQRPQDCPAIVLHADPEGIARADSEAIPSLLHRMLGAEGLMQVFGTPDPSGAKRINARGMNHIFMVALGGRLAKCVKPQAEHQSEARQAERLRNEAPNLVADEHAIFPLAAFVCQAASPFFQNFSQYEITVFQYLDGCCSVGDLVRMYERSHPGNVLQSTAACPCHRNNGTCEHIELLRCLVVGQVAKLSVRFQKLHGRRHGDFKSDNILIDKNGMPRVTDFLSPFCSTCDRDEFMKCLTSLHPNIQALQGEFDRAWRTEFQQQQQQQSAQASIIVDPASAGRNLSLKEMLDSLAASSKQQPMFGPMPALLDNLKLATPSLSATPASEHSEAPVGFMCSGGGISGAADARSTPTPGSGGASTGTSGGASLTLGFFSAGGLGGGSPAASPLRSPGRRNSVIGDRGRIPPVLLGSASLEGTCFVGLQSQVPPACTPSPGGATSSVPLIRGPPSPSPTSSRRHTPQDSNCFSFSQLGQQTPATPAAFSGGILNTPKQSDLEQWRQRLQQQQQQQKQQQLQQQQQLQLLQQQQQQQQQLQQLQLQQQQQLQEQKQREQMQKQEYALQKQRLLQQQLEYAQRKQQQLWQQHLQEQQEEIQQKLLLEQQRETYRKQRQQYEEEQQIRQQRQREQNQRRMGQQEQERERRWRARLRPETAPSQSMDTHRTQNPLGVALEELRSWSPLDHQSLQNRSPARAGNGGVAGGSMIGSWRQHSTNGGGGHVSAPFGPDFLSSGRQSPTRGSGNGSKTTGLQPWISFSKGAFNV